MPLNINSNLQKIPEPDRLSSQNSISSVKSKNSKRK